jgi:hypothetical protein
MDTLATVVFRSSAIRKPGKYISIENGPSAVRDLKLGLTENILIWI